MPEDKKSGIEREKIKTEDSQEQAPAAFSGPESARPDLPARHEIPVKIDRPGKPIRPETPSALPGSDRPELKSGPAPAASSPARQAKIEAIMSKGLQEPYLRLPREKQLAFKRKGEETALIISNLIGQGKASMKKVLILIRDWLLLLSGLNPFFIEQEAKLKADEIMALKDISGLNGHN